MGTEIHPFRIEIPSNDVDDLQDRLRRTRWGGEIPDQGWSRGVPVDYLKQLAAYWADGYDWRLQESRLNELPQFTTDIERAVDPLRARPLDQPGRHASAAHP